MQPQPAGPAEWMQISQALLFLALGVGAGLLGAFSTLVAYGVLPSLVATADAPASVLGLRRLLLPVALLATALMLLALWHGLSLAVGVAWQLYPRLAV